MRIEIQLLTQFEKYLPEPDSAGNVRSLEVKENATIEDVMRTLGIPLDASKVMMVSNRQATIKDVLRQGDRVTVFPPVGGG